MRRVTLALCLAAPVYGLATANESRHAATDDKPETATLTHASPDTWDALPPVQPNVSLHQLRHRLSETPVFGQVGRLQPKCGSTDISRNGLSLVEFFDTDHS
jgi:hypothetical protein